MTGKVYRRPSQEAEVGRRSSGYGIAPCVFIPSIPICVPIRRSPSQEVEALRTTHRGSTHHTHQARSKTCCSTTGGGGGNMLVRVLYQFPRSCIHNMCYPEHTLQPSAGFRVVNEACPGIRIRINTCMFLEVVGLGLS